MPAVWGEGKDAAELVFRESSEGEAMADTARTWTLRALTAIWTGDAKGKGDHLVPTGLMGSLRWWFEVLVRGLGGQACDPTSKDVRCPAPGKQPTDPGHHCVVCELFGCTGWARKFRLMVLDEGGQVLQDQIKAGQVFKLRFIPLRRIREEEWCLLDLTLRLIADYGAIGGKTVLKPSDEQGRENADHHQDFGLIHLQSSPGDVCRPMTRKALEEYVSDTRWRRNFDNAAFSWASLNNFWCVKGRYLARQDAHTSTFNRVVGRDERKLCKYCEQAHEPGKKSPKTKRHSMKYSDDNPRDLGDAWLAGRQQESKKVFSFKHPEEGRRTFGFVDLNVVAFDTIKHRLRLAWGN
ncbi:MAG: type III-B CRISPR module RAMP protein Cmr1, partial [Thermoanaerobaculum sp.]|nr:type III-B CRISPR module RAMP protein Cmr1 [Thermoanaerobaculum sp.]